MDLMRFAKENVQSPKNTSPMKPNHAPESCFPKEIRTARKLKENINPDVSNIPNDTNPSTTLKKGLRVGFIVSSHRPPVW